MCIILKSNNYESTIKKLDEKNKRLKKLFEEESKQNQAKYEKELLYKEIEYEKKIKAKVDEQIKKQKALDKDIEAKNDEIENLKKKIDDLKDQVKDLESKNKELERERNNIRNNHSSRTPEVGLNTIQVNENFEHGLTDQTFSPSFSGEHMLRPMHGRHDSLPFPSYRTIMNPNEESKGDTISQSDASPFSTNFRAMIYSPRLSVSNSTIDMQSERGEYFGK